VRVLGVDFGLRRIGLALSDPTATLATPWMTLPASATPAASAGAVASAIDRPPGGDGVSIGEIDAVVVGLPRRLDGSDTELSLPVRQFAAALADLVGRPVHLQDERLSSREAESRLAVREKDWRRRKKKLDEAAAAIVLQDFLDGRSRDSAEPAADEPA
jgi:putative Holliday junction resolvase